MTDFKKYLLKIPKLFLVAGSLWTILLLLPNRATANPNQFVRVHQLSNISPMDGRAQRLKSLSDRTLCLGDNYRLSDRPITRSEFAVELKECIDRLDIYNLTPEEFDFIARMERDFASELAALGQRLDNLEARTKKIETLL